MFYTYSKDVQLILLEFTFAIFLPFLPQIFRNSTGRGKEQAKNLFPKLLFFTVQNLTTLTGQTHTYKKNQ